MIDFSQLKLRERILLGYAIPLILTVGATGVVVANAARVATQNQATELDSRIVQGTDRLELFLYKRQSNVRGYLLTRNDVFAKDYEESVRDYEQAVASLEDIISFSGGQQVERLQKLKVLGQEISKINRKLIALVEAGKVNEASQELLQGPILSLLDQAGALLQDLNSTEDELQALRAKESEAAMRSLLSAAVVGTLAAIALAVVMGLLISSRISKTIDNIASVMASSSTEIAVAVEQQERTVSQQAVSVSQTTTAMDELSVASLQSAEQATSAATSANQVLVLVEGVDRANSWRSSDHESLRDKVEQIAKQILELSDKTNQIGTISTLVSDLANQTNMLALNAAVEASRAGEQGKGFSVIALEIRKLADQSRKSAERIGLLVTDIQNATNSTVMVTDEGTKTVESVISAINDIALNNQQISLTSKQQAIAIQQVVDAMNSINQGANQTASSISQTRVSTRQLNEAALSLKKIV